MRNFLIAAGLLLAAILPAAAQPLAPKPSKLDRNPTTFACSQSERRACIEARKRYYPAFPG
jgi:hypothetical protein